MKTLMDTIKSLSLVLEQNTAGAEESLRVLDLTKAYLSLTAEMHMFDPTVTAAQVHEMAAERMRRIACRVPGGPPGTAGEPPALLRQKK
jgi:hypothetical protein